MTDPLDQLKKALDTTTPAPDKDMKAANIRLAQKNFDQIQGSAQHARPTSENRSNLARLLTGVSGMIDALTSRGGIVATTAIVAVGLIIVTPQGRSLFTPPVNFTDQEEPIGSLPSQPKPDLSQENLPEREDVGKLAKSSDAPSRRDLRKQEAPMMEEPMIMAEEVAESDDVFVSGAIAPAPMSLDSNLSRNRQHIVAPSEPASIRSETNTETFANAPSNPLKITVEDPVSTFSIDVDTAAYAVVRSSLNAGTLPPAQAVRVEEMINYFPYDYVAPDAGVTPFRPTVTILDTPWNADTQLVHIALQGQMPALDTRPPLNIVFLIDTSGSMQDANKLPLLKQSFRLMLGQLRPEDKVAIVTYAGSAGQVLEPTPASERSTILAALEHLEAGGSTAGQQGLQQAYSVAENMADDGDVTRVILATDGDFNVGISAPGALKEFIAQKRDSGTYLSVLGFGRGNLDDTTMQALAQNGNGQAAYIDTLNEAQKVLVDQLSGALFPIANDVKIQVEFNPATIAEYRLIGYETRTLNREDFNNDKVDAGEIGAGHSVTAIYEITPVGSDAVLNDPLRYQTEKSVATSADELGFLRLRYKSPGASISQLIQTPIFTDMAPISTDAQFSVAMAGFGQLLRGSNYVADWSWGEAIALATQARGADDFGYRAEAINLMRLAQSLSVE